MIQAIREGVSAEHNGFGQVKISLVDETGQAWDADLTPDNARRFAEQVADAAFEADGEDESPGILGIFRTFDEFDNEPTILLVSLVSCGLAGCPVCG